MLVQEAEKALVADGAEVPVNVQQVAGLQHAVRCDGERCGGNWQQLSGSACLTGLCQPLSSKHLHVWVCSALDEVEYLHTPG